MIKHVRRGSIAFCLLLACTTPALAQVYLEFSVPGANIGLNLGGYPTLQRIPGYPVYYAPSLNRNFFFYDGMYWVYEDDSWYASSWYNGPWALVDPFYVPDFILRVPVRYYRHAPTYFRSWRVDAAPRWEQHWGRSWYERRRDWDRWDRRYSPAPAPLPTYQRNYRGDRYPSLPAQQADLQTRNYRYQPREAVTREHFQERRRDAETWRSQQGDRGRWEDRRDERRQQQEAQRNQRELRQETQRQERYQRQEAQRQDRDQRQEAQRQERDQRQEAQRQQREQREQQARPQPQGRPDNDRGRGPDRGPDRGRGQDRPNADKQPDVGQGG
jgi:hypothetical protein